MNADPRGERRMQAALDRLAEKLAGSTFRSALREDPASAATTAGIDPDALPEGLLATLGLMSDEELQIVARVQKSLQGSVRDPASVGILF